MDDRRANKGSREREGNEPRGAELGKFPPLGTHGGIEYKSHDSWADTSRNEKKLRKNRAWYRIVCLTKSAGSWGGGWGAEDTRTTIVGEWRQGFRGHSVEQPQRVRGYAK